MQIGYIGLGKMGLAMAERLHEKGYEVSGYDPNVRAGESAELLGVRVVPDTAALVTRLTPPRLVWLMAPHSAVEEIVGELLQSLQAGDTVIDGSNSFFEDSARRAEMFAKEGIEFLDVGVSGGPRGAREGACLMVGGREETYRKHVTLFNDLSTERGYGYMGVSGAGHFVKMAHNGIEYGMMQSLAEGFAFMRQAPLNLDIEEVARVYARGSIIESKLIEYLRQAFKHFGKDLEQVSGAVAESGEGRWAVETAKKVGVPTPALEAALAFREASRKNPTYAGKLLTALRNQFGGHAADPEHKKA